MIPFSLTSRCLKCKQVNSSMKWCKGNRKYYPETGALFEDCNRSPHDEAFHRVCSRCGYTQLMKLDDETHTIINGPLGEIKINKVTKEETKTCHDCGVTTGDFHKDGCDWEECPNCGRQLISCDCNDTYPSIPYGEEKRFGKEVEYPDPENLKEAKYESITSISGLKILSDYEYRERLLRESVGVLGSIINNSPDECVLCMEPVETHANCYLLILKGRIEKELSQ